ncbi:uncharacterized protein LOC105699499 [Orussus abietinus]|uniref:uncharacterized protein LOC105699499 n=1 Tax=Orussus abietinus TaxID=222816 RepID=UPI0006257F95|nr:uncharacterized protein LOC105699499 [Orussus abietinus]
MRRQCTVFLWLCFVVSSKGNLIVANDSSPYCLQFTWLGPMHNSHSAVKVNCSGFVGVPCVEPYIVTEDSTPPNITYMWSHLNHSMIGCPLKNGYVCLKYSYTYNNAVLNSTHFCGKMIEDTTTAVTSGCYSQQIRGHTVEVCACRSRNGSVPCNDSTANNISVIIMSSLLLTIIYHTVQRELPLFIK